MIGRRIGTFELTAKLGEGGMGEVYRATDSRLKREVAIKVLPAAFTSDPERLDRFEREAQLLAQLHHPHIASIFGLEESDGVRALVMELVEGPTLAERLAAGPLSLEEGCAIGGQIAEALEAAHDKGIVHRDLKPANVKLTADGTVKVLDFGLAKALEATAAGASGPTTLMNSPTLTGDATRMGVILGTAAYMSPEQARGGPVDKRADIWSFGVVMFEMLTGKQLFAGETASDTLAAVLRQEVDLRDLPVATPASLRQLLARCLERNPKNRLRDIGEARVALSGSADAQAEPPGSARPRPRSWWPVPVAVASGAALAALACVALLRPAAPSAPPEFQRLTFQRGTISNARFAPDGGIVYSARWGAGSNEIYSVRAASPESRPLGFTNATLFAVSSGEELALRLRPRYWSTFFHGTLARAPLAGGTPREITEDVQEADWNPDGSSYAVLRLAQGSTTWQVEYPPGKVLASTVGYALTGVRFAPDGKHIAMLSGGPWTTEPQITLLGLDGSKQLLTKRDRISGMAWAPAGHEIWFSRTDSKGGSSSLWAVDLKGSERLLLRHAGELVLRDIAKDGSVLATVDRTTTNVLLRVAGTDRERDFSWLDSTVASDLSADGRTLLFNEAGGGGGTSGASFYIRSLDGSAPIRLGDGYANALSPDGRWVLTQLPLAPDHLEIVPTGPGSPRTIPLPPGYVISGFQAWFFPEGQRILINATRSDGSLQLFAVDLGSGAARKVAPSGWDNFIGELPISPDGQWVDGQKGGIGSVIVDTFRSDGSGVHRPVTGYQPDDVIIRWAVDNHSLFVFRRNELPARVDRLDIATGARTRWLDLMPADSAGVVRILSVVMSPDGRTYAYNVQRQLSDLYLIRGLH